MRHSRDVSGELEKLGNKIIKKEPKFDNLMEIRILYTFVSPPRKDKEDTIAGRAIILPAKIRDLFGFDAEIEIAETVWIDLTKRAKVRLLWHELRHIQPEINPQTGEICTDKDGRFKLTAVDHDVKILGFQDEIKRFGISEHNMDQVKFLSKMFVKTRRGKKKVDSHISEIKEGHVF